MLEIGAEKLKAGNELKLSPTSPTVKIRVFVYLECRRNLGWVRKIDLSPTTPGVRDVYDFEFSLVGRQSENSEFPIVWDFPDI